MAVTVRQVAGNPGGIINSSSVTLGSPTTTGDFVVFVMGRTTTGAGTPSNGLTDTYGNSWVLVDSLLRDDFVSAWWIAAYVCVGGNAGSSHQFTFTDANSEGFTFGIVVYELEGAKVSSFVGDSDTQTGDTVDIFTDPLVWASPDNLALGAAVAPAVSQTWTPASGWTVGYEWESGISAQPTFASIYKLGVTGNTTVEWTGSNVVGAWSALGLLVKEQGAALTPSLVPNLFPRIPRTSLTR